MFLELIYPQELKQIYRLGQKSLIALEQDSKEYFKRNRENPSLVNQIRAYSSLIVLRIKDYCDRQDINLEIENEASNSSSAWWEKIVGTVSDDSAYDEAMKIGREYRNSFRPDAE